MKAASIPRKALLDFEAGFDASFEDKALNARGQFLRAFPIRRLKDLTVDDYVIGRGTPSFCAHVEAKTIAWAPIQGATAYKFGIYFGKTKSEPQKKYRFTSKFGTNRKEAFSAVKTALLDLINAGRKKDFSKIDGNPLSQMFKAKILSLYFPDEYLNVCSEEHIEQIALKLGLPAGKCLSEYQHFLIRKKLENPVSKNWSNPRFTAFLLSTYIHNRNEKVAMKPFKSHRQINFEDISADRDAIGAKSEKYALKWEKDRLIGCGYKNLISKIEDHRKAPSYGYDFLSYSAPRRKRYIEVKSVGKDRKGSGFRFYLSDNEHSVSTSKECKKGYYFYLVFYGNDGSPSHLLPVLADEIYKRSNRTPCAYVVSFRLE